MAAASPTSPNHDKKVWINEVKKKVDEVGPQHHSLRQCTIFEVPKHIRRLDPDAYTPVIVPIGPFHHDPSSAMQEHKWRCVHYLLSRRHDDGKLNNLLEECLLELEKLDEHVRSRYSKKFSSLTAQDMAKIMLLDGCFIIHLLLEHAVKEREEEKKRWEVVLEVEEEKGKREEEQASGVAGGKRVGGAPSGTKETPKKIEGPFEAGLFTVKVLLYDLLKLENQIPFLIIQTLFGLLKVHKDEDKNLPQRVLDLFCNIQPSESKSVNALSKDPNSIHHLLHLFHSSRTVISPRELGNRIGCGLLQLFHPSRTVNSSQELENTTGCEWIPSAMELRQVGVKFRKKKKGANFLDITFDKGRMEIPPLSVTDHTCSIFRNLIAFEQCYANATAYVTTYAVFMDCLIDEANDAHLLHLKGIVVNRLGTDKALAALFNKLCNQIHYSPDKDYLAKLFMKVNKHYNSKRHKWWAVLKRNYLSTPWAIASVTAAVLLLLHADH